MRFYSLVAIAGTLVLASAGGCGYLPSELNPSEESEGENANPAAKAGTQVIQHTVSCDTPARGFRRVKFRDLYAITGKREQPFRKSSNTPEQYDLLAYVWGYENCTAENCGTGDYYLLVGRGPGRDFSKWAVTPQLPRVTIQSTCRQRLKVGERYRFSVSRDKLVGFSR